MRKFRKYTATALVAMMVAGMTMSGYQPADVSGKSGKRYIIVTKDKKIYENSRKQIQYNDRYSRTKYRSSKR